MKLNETRFKIAVCLGAAACVGIMVYGVVFFVLGWAGAEMLARERDIDRVTMEDYRQIVRAFDADYGFTVQCIGGLIGIIGAAVGYRRAKHWLESL